MSTNLKLVIMFAYLIAFALVLFTQVWVLPSSEEIDANITYTCDDPVYRLASCS